MVNPAIPRIPLANLPERYRSAADMIEPMSEATTVQFWAHSQTAPVLNFDSFYKELFYIGQRGTVLDVRSSSLSD